MLTTPARSAGAMRGTLLESPDPPLLLLAEAVGLLRSGAAPHTVWKTAGFTHVDSVGAPVGAPQGGEPHPAWDGVRAAARLAHSAGAPLADVLEVVARHERARSQADAARKAAIAGPQLSGTVLSWLPAAGLGLGVLVDSRAFHILFLTALGWLLLVLAGALAALGRGWMKRLVASAEAASQDSAPGQLPLELVLALVDSAVAAGLDVRAALATVGSAVEGAQGKDLAHVASLLALGHSWADSWGDASPTLAPVERALRPAWVAGASPRSTLAAVSQVLTLDRQIAAEQAVGELGVRMALPLTLCLLPAFALVGLVPMLVAVASNAQVSLG